jgi:hypothetical protein
MLKTLIKLYIQVTPSAKAAAELFKKRKLHKMEDTNSPAMPKSRTIYPQNM